jgi:hypothetical protein
MLLAPQDNYMSSFPSRDCVLICHPGQVRRRGTRAGILKKSDYIEPSLYSTSTLLRTVSVSTTYLTCRLGDSSGMTDESDRAIISKRRWGYCGAK